MKSILLFGSNGFIGSNISRYEQKKKKYILIQPSFAECDLLKSEQVNRVVIKYQPDFIINTAFIGEVNSQIAYSDSYILNNIRAYSHILKGSTESKKLKKIFFFGSSLEYDDSHKLINERGRIGPKNNYALTKTLTSLYAMYQAQQYGLPLVIFRPFNLYGPYDTKSVIHYLISTILSNETPTISEGNQIRDYLYIDDLARIIHSCLENWSTLTDYQCYNIGSGKPVLLKQIFQTIFKFTSFKSTSKTTQMRRLEYRNQVADITKVKKIVAFPKKLMSLSKGLEKTISWIRKQQKYKENS